mmetsp:Transcript_100654/g.260566  ORF Transcript_100654/g.260566 Transcript_100654/m.260566 type:complete len:218 (+) Transcript_100654:415-1068(+)
MDLHALHHLCTSHSMAKSSELPRQVHVVLQDAVVRDLTPHVHEDVVTDPRRPGLRRAAKAAGITTSWCKHNGADLEDAMAPDDYASAPCRVKMRAVSTDHRKLLELIRRASTDRPPQDGSLKDLACFAEDDILVKRSVGLHPAPWTKLYIRSHHCELADFALATQRDIVLEYNPGEYTHRSLETYVRAQADVGRDVRGEQWPRDARSLASIAGGSRW